MSGYVCERQPDETGQYGQRTYLLVGSLVAHNSNCLDGEENRECLANLVVKIRSANLFDVDAIGLLQGLHLFARDWAEDSDGETGTWEWVALNQRGRDRQQPTQRANFIYNKKIGSLYTTLLVSDINLPLNSSRRGSMSFSFISFSSPPTLWCVLIVALGPLKLILSITSG